MKLVRLLGQPHPFPVLRLAALKEWVDSGAYATILDGDYPTRAGDADATSRRSSWVLHDSTRKTWSRVPTRSPQPCGTRGCAQSLQKTVVAAFRGRQYSGPGKRKRS